MTIIIKLDRFQAHLIVTALRVVVGGITSSSSTGCLRRLLLRGPTGTPTTLGRRTTAPTTRVSSRRRRLMLRGSMVGPTASITPWELSE